MTMDYELWKRGQDKQNYDNFVDLSNCNVFYSSNHFFSLYVYWWISALFPFKAVQSAWERKFYPKMVFLPKRFLDFFFFEKLKIMFTSRQKTVTMQSIKMWFYPGYNSLSERLDKLFGEPCVFLTFLPVIDFELEKLAYIQNICH